MSEIIPPYLSSTPPPIVPDDEEDDDIGEFTSANDYYNEYDGLSLPTTPQHSKEEEIEGKNSLDSTSQNSEQFIIGTSDSGLSSENNISSGCYDLPNNNLRNDLESKNKERCTPDTSHVEIGKSKKMFSYDILAKSVINLDQTNNLENLNQTTFESKENENTLDSDDDFSDFKESSIKSIEISDKIFFENNKNLEKIISDIKSEKQTENTILEEREFCEPKQILENNENVDGFSKESSTKVNQIDSLKLNNCENQVYFNKDVISDFKTSFEESSNLENFESVIQKESKIFSKENKNKSTIETNSIDEEFNDFESFSQTQLNSKTIEPVQVLSELENFEPRFSISNQNDFEDFEAFKSFSAEKNTKKTSNLDDKKFSNVNLKEFNDFESFQSIEKSKISKKNLENQIESMESKNESKVQFEKSITINNEPNQNSIENIKNSNDTLNECKKIESSESNNEFNDFKSHTIDTNSDSDEDFNDFESAPRINKPSEIKDYKTSNLDNEFADFAACKLTKQNEKSNFEFSKSYSDDLILKQTPTILEREKLNEYLENTFENIFQAEQLETTCETNSNIKSHRSNEEAYTKTLDKIENVSSFKYHWEHSKAFSKLLDVLKIDVRNILYGPNMPRFAATLNNNLEPLKPVPATSSEKNNSKDFSTTNVGNDVTYESSAKSLEDHLIKIFESNMKNISNISYATSSSYLDEFSTESWRYWISSGNNKDDQNDKKLKANKLIDDKSMLPQIGIENKQLHLPKIDNSDNKSVKSLKFDDFDIDNDTKIVNKKDLEVKLGDDEFNDFQSSNNWQNKKKSTILLRETHIDNIYDSKIEDLSKVHVKHFGKDDNATKNGFINDFESFKKDETISGLIHVQSLLVNQNSVKVPENIKTKIEVNTKENDEEFTDFKCMPLAHGSVKNLSSMPNEINQNKILEPLKPVSVVAQSKLEINWPNPGLSDDLELEERLKTLKINKNEQESDEWTDFVCANNFNSGNQVMTTIQSLNSKLTNNKQLTKSNDSQKNCFNQMQTIDVSTLGLVQQNAQIDNKIGFVTKVKENSLGTKEIKGQNNYEDDNWTDFVSNRNHTQTNVNSISKASSWLQPPQFTSWNAPSNSFVPNIITNPVHFVDHYSSSPQKNNHNNSTIQYPQQFANSQSPQQNKSSPKISSSYHQKNTAAASSSNNLSSMNLAQNVSPPHQNYHSAVPVYVTSNKYNQTHHHITTSTPNYSTNNNNSISTISSLPDLDFLTPKKSLPNRSKNLLKK